ncbi:MAG: hypothetical protein J0M15_09275 [Deltaproteobacteria bacterium]|jgi:hypothetical protein|nr:hypothetical protein [Deltaproteobacteria bacterium]
MKAFLFLKVVIICCFFETTSMSIPCWKNEAMQSIMPAKICFSKIFLEKNQNEFKKIYLLNDDFEDLLPINTLEKETNNSYKVGIKSDYINYSESCGLNLFSRIIFNGFFSSDGKYMKHEKSKLTIKFNHSRNICKEPLKSGSENYLPLPD